MRVVDVAGQSLSALQPPLSLRPPPASSECNPYACAHSHAHICFLSSILVYSGVWPSTLYAELLPNGTLSMPSKGIWICTPHHPRP